VSRSLVGHNVVVFDITRNMRPMAPRHARINSTVRLNATWLNNSRLMFATLHR